MKKKYCSILWLLAVIFMNFSAAAQEQTFDVSYFIISGEEMLSLWELVDSLIEGTAREASPQATTPTTQAPISAILDGRALAFDVPPAVIDGRTMVPMRVIFEALGAEIYWDGRTQTITATASGLEIISQIGDMYIFVNGARTRMDVAPVIMNGRTLVPVRFVSEAFGAEVVWDGENRIVSIYSAISGDDWDDWGFDEREWIWEDWDMYLGEWDY
jgi:hypothetical protein